MGNHLPETKRRLDAEYRERNRVALREKAKARRLAIRLEAFKHYGMECSDNDGAAERKQLGGQQFSGWKFYEHLCKLGYPSGYQTLCANCNVIKHVEYMSM